MAMSYSEQEDSIKKAISDFEDGIFRSAASAAKYYGIKPRRLQLRLAGHKSKSTRPSTFIRLTKV